MKPRMTLKPSMAIVRYKGVDLTAIYEIDGRYLPATLTDEAETPIAILTNLLANDLDIFNLISEDDRREIEMLIEEQFK